MCATSKNTYKKYFIFNIYLQIFAAKCLMQMQHINKYKINNALLLLISLFTMMLIYMFAYRPVASAE